MKFHSTALFVKDITVSKEFYTKFLGFTIEHDFGNNVALHEGLSLWEIQPEHQISKELKTKNESNRFELYFEAENIKKIFEVLEKAEIKFLNKIYEEPWGQKAIRFFDPDDHLIEIGEPLEVFVNNMKNNGLSPKQISEKSGIPIETVQSILK